MSKSIERPSIVTDEYLEFLDDLRDSGVTNMFGAGPYLTRNFKLTTEEARAILGYWMDTFGESNR